MTELEYVRTLAEIDYTEEDLVRIALSCLESKCREWMQISDEDVDPAAYDHYNSLRIVAEYLRRTKYPR